MFRERKILLRPHMKHINESIIGRRGSMILSNPIYIIRHKSGIESPKNYAALYINKEDFASRLAEIGTLPGLDKSYPYLQNIIDEDSDGLIWAEEWAGKPSFHCLGLKSTFDVDRITKIPLRHPNHDYRFDRFEIIKWAGVVNIDDYKDIYDCFEKNKFFHNLI